MVEKWVTGQCVLSFITSLSAWLWLDSVVHSHPSWGLDAGAGALWQETPRIDIQHFLYPKQMFVRPHCRVGKLALTGTWRVQQPLSQNIDKNNRVAMLSVSVYSVRLYWWKTSSLPDRFCTLTEESVRTEWDEQDNEQRWLKTNQVFEFRKGGVGTFGP